MLVNNSKEQSIIKNNYIIYYKMGWLPVIPHCKDPIKCHLCEKILQDPTFSSSYFIIWTPDDDPEDHPHNIYYICPKHKKDALKVNTHFIKVATNTRLQNFKQKIKFYSHINNK